MSETTAAGSYTDAITIDGGKDENYRFVYVPADFEVTKAILTVGSPDIVISKIYDGTTNAVVNPFSTTGITGFDQDNLQVSASAVYDNALVGTDKTITVSYSLSGSAADNYVAPETFTLTTGEITAKQLTISDPALVTIKEFV